MSARGRRSRLIIHLDYPHSVQEHDGAVAPLHKRELHETAYCITTLEPYDITAAQQKSELVRRLLAAVY